MAETTNPTELARETLKVLASRRISPTPQNYQRIFHEIAGTAPEAGLQARLLAQVREVAARHPDDGALRALERALERNDLEAVGTALRAISGRGERAPAGLGSALREVLRQLETPHRGLSQARKREGLERLLITAGSDLQLPARLEALAKCWAETPADAPVVAPLHGEAAEAPPAAPAVSESDTPQEGLLHEAGELLASVLENGVAPHLDRYADVHAEVIAASRRARELDGPAALALLARQLEQLWLDVQLRVEPDQEVLDNLLGLLGAMGNYPDALVASDPWVASLLELLRTLASTPPDLHTIRDAERDFKAVLARQASIQSGLDEAKATLKSLLSSFVERLGEVAANTGDYHGRIQHYAQCIDGTDSLETLRGLLDDMMVDTRGMQLGMLRSRDELVAARQQAEGAEKRVRELEAELVRVSEQVREDQLTGTLNRRGMDDALGRELARVRRNGKPLSVMVLDVDDFKKLNDSHGHAAGDAALVHLARVIKHTVRPIDSIARYGGEEFVIILSETGLEHGVLVAERLQRELTRRFFLHRNERLLITFSAGVAQHVDGEDADALVQRADMAMYQAKLLGKNRVVAA